MTKPLSTITLLELRHKTEEVIRRVQAGEPLMLTKRGKPVLQLQPVKPAQTNLANDAFGRLVLKYRKPTRTPVKKTPLTNEQMDKIIYGY
jgi:prevent-host-death family protein